MKPSKTQKQLLYFTILLLVMTLLFLYLYQSCHQSWMLSVYVTLLTTFYHFSMRLIVGKTIASIYKKRDFHVDSIGFRIRSYEAKLYQMLQVKRWKTKVITASPEQFDLKKTGPVELLHSVLQAELVHRVIMVLSFLPLLLIIPYGVPLVFIVTSVLACLFDLIFVMIQRYNRPRIIRLVERYDKTARFQLYK